jgi:hypothetical protein
MRTVLLTLLLCLLPLTIHGAEVQKEFEVDRGYTQVAATLVCKSQEILNEADMSISDIEFEKLEIGNGYISTQRKVTIVARLRKEERKIRCREILKATKESISLLIEQIEEDERIKGLASEIVVLKGEKNTKISLRSTAEVSGESSFIVRIGLIISHRKVQNAMEKALGIDNQPKN